MAIAPARVRIGVGEVRLSEQAKRNIQRVLETDRLSYGPFSKEFEQRFAALHHRRFACFVNSGTDALRIGLAAMKERYGWQDGDEVLVPAVTFVASYNVIAQVGLKPVLVDIEPDYYSMDMEQVTALVGRNEAARYKQPVAIMPVHLFGHVSELEVSPPDLKVLARVLGIRVIADSCETMFVDGCAQGDVSCFSTYACHLINTGVGGLATTNDPETARIIRSLANHGRDGIYTGIDETLGNMEIIDARFRFERMGYSSRATEFEAAIGCAELDVWEDNIFRRRENAARLLAGLAGLPLSLPKIRPSGQHAWMMFPLRAPDRDTKDRLVQHLESAGIETRPLLPLTSQPYLKALGVREENYPIAQMVNQTGFYVGCHQYIEPSDIDYMVETFRAFSW